MYKLTTDPEKYNKPRTHVSTTLNNNMTNPNEKRYIYIYPYYLVSLKYNIRMMANTRTMIMDVTIHLFLFILLDMLVKILLLFPMLSSTP